MRAKPTIIVFYINSAPRRVQRRSFLWGYFPAAAKPRTPPPPLPPEPPFPATPPARNTVGGQGLAARDTARSGGVRRPLSSRAAALRVFCRSGNAPGGRSGLAAAAPRPRGGPALSLSHGSLRPAAVVQVRCADRGATWRVPVLLKPARTPPAAPVRSAPAAHFVNLFGLHAPAAGALFLFSRQKRGGKRKSASRHGRAPASL